MLLEVKIAPAADGTVEGYASLFGPPADAVGDIVAPGAFTASLADGPPEMLREHRGGPVGEWTDVGEDDMGLRVRGKVTDPATLADLRAGRLDGLSIGYVAVKSRRDSEGRRILDAVNLHEVSVVKRPASSRARVLSVKNHPHQKGIPMIDPATAPDPDEDGDGTPQPLEDRVSNLENTVADHGKRLSAIEANTERAVKSLAGIEVAMRRPGARVGAAEDREVRETKAFETFLRRGREGMGFEETKSLVVADDTSGGYLAPPQFVREIVKNIVLISPVRQVAKVMSTSSNRVLLPKRTGTPTAAWVGENQTRTESQSAYGSLEFLVAEMATFTDVSNVMIEDSAFDIGAEITSDLAQQFARAEGAAFVNGTGVNQPMGFMSDPSVGYVPTGNASALTADSLIALFHALPTFYAVNAVWAMNRQTLGAIRSLKDNNGRYLLSFDGLPDKPAPTILGRPVVEMPDMPNVAGGAEPVAFGDFKSGYRIFDRLAVAMLRDPFTQQAQGQVRFHARRRVAGGVSKGEAILKLKVSVS